MPEFTVIPAIDLKGGKCVRLRQGRADDQTVYADDPLEVAWRWEAQGAAWLHVVDLDGAFRGHPVHTDIIRAIAGNIKIPVEAGGGLRTDEDLQALLDGGVARLIVGTRACRNPEALARLTARFGAKLAVGIDARAGRVQVHGWTETTEQDAVSLAARLAQLGVATLIYTDTERDGMLAGPNVAAVDEVCARVACRVIASGGVAAAAQVAALRQLKRVNLAGVIVGKALYDGTVTLKALQGAAQEAG